MSQITENIIAIHPKNQRLFQSDYARKHDEYRLSNLNMVYSDENIIVYVFDCNGDNPWHNGDVTCTVLINETNYLDGEELYTEYVNEEGLLEDSDEPAAELLKHYIPAAEYEAVLEKIAYTC